MSSQFTANPRPSAGERIESVPGPSAPEPFSPNDQEYGSEEKIRSRAGTSQSGKTFRNSSGEENGLDVQDVPKASEFHSPEAKATNNLTPAAGSAATEPGAGKPKLEKFKYGFWDTEMTMFRKIAFKILAGTIVITIVVMWLCLPFYWGSLWKSNRYTNKLTVRVIDRDGGEIGQTFSQGLLSQTNLNYFATDPSEFPTAADVAHDIVEEGAWASIVINAGVSDALLSARENGNSSWNGLSVIDVYYAQARQETAINSYLIPSIQQALSQLSFQYNTQSAATYLQDNINNATALSLVAQAPTTVTNAVWFSMNNLRPYNQPVAQAITLVGLIYMLIFAFIMTMTNNAVREIIAPFLTTRSYIMYRLVSPLCLYFPVSFFFAMINLPFKVDFGAHFTYAGGFFLWWFALFLGMAAVGLSTEAAITVLGPKFMAFFLVPLIIVNVSVVSLPHELQPWIYRYGVAMPFYNCSHIVRTIIFNTKNEIGQNMGILIAWVVVNFITISLGTWLFRRRSVNQHNKEVGENEMDSFRKV
ncbi:endoplasmic reticulum protein [Cryptococcus gattii Ru294]|uniref:Response to drug-related protein, putative n=1 Tax=Cryptococcus gattii serotype B (strain WM276 / ATCC MYA-4071) TaxID=367775 RepID=E6R508_CRYGW|nr:response to drug-related protein, putative [Cryptococcus gattii WM276]ADV22219.1 response to drug-related protein, putative [Cryptococcus gattii WM276]KIR56906.1 endoplasmic reticulum protein [Cryptococcus gattii Ru294]KIY33614.1 endoplasmic reticulum protein [Cryptococcus gattii E566]KJE03507.1 endoplasmic reticulum protein [Cryptococcus gattii NT-10]